MKAIQHILFSYFRQPVFSTIFMVIGVIFFVVGTVNTLTRPGLETSENWYHWDFFLLALVLLGYVMGMHLSRLLQSSACVLLPNYRQKQLLAAGILLALFILFPTLISGLKGFSVAISLSLLLATASYCLWTFFYFGENIFSGVILLWFLRLFYECSGLKTKLIIFGPFSDYFPNAPALLLPVLLIVISTIALVAFVRYFLTVSMHRFAAEESDQNDPWARDFDRIGRVVRKLVKKKLNRATIGLSQQPTSVFRLVRHFQFSLFSPNNVVTIYSFATLIAMFNLMILLYFQHGSLPPRMEVAPLLNFIFIILIGILATDFLQHRSRMVSLWFQSQVSSRKKFTRLVALTFLFVAGRLYLTLSIILLGVSFLTTLLTAFDALRIVLLGAVENLLVISLCLIFSEEITSPDARGWTVSNIFLWILLLIIILNTWTALTWGTLLALLGLSVALLGIALYKWESTEINFVSPEPPA